jgi:hypothetical protein
MSWLRTMASISSRLSAGTRTITGSAGVTTPPTLWTEICCTTPSTGAVKIWRWRFCSAFTSREAPRLLVGLRHVTEHRAAVLGFGLSALLHDGGDGIVGLVGGGALGDRRTTTAVSGLITLRAAQQRGGEAVRVGEAAKPQQSRRNEDCGFAANWLSHRLTASL